MRTRITTRRHALTAAAVLLLLPACGNSGRSEAGTASSPGPAGDVGTLIDVRTPEEFAQGHLEGAINIDFSAATFDAEIGELDTQATYTVYCRSGNRSAQAVARMKELGFTDVHDAGGYEAASAELGIPIVTQ